MKKTFLFLSVCSAFIASSMAQGQPPSGNREKPSPEGMSNMIVEDFRKEVELTETEKDAIKAVFLEFFSKMDEMHESGERPEQSKMEAMDADRNTKIKEIIPDKRYDTFLTFIDSHMKPPQGDQPPPRQ